MAGSGKRVYYEAVREAAKSVIASPITTDDIEIEIAYATDVKKTNRKDTDNVNKPTLDALEGVAYLNDRQVRSVNCTLFSKLDSSIIDGRVEDLCRLFYSNRSHIVLIRVYSDTRLAELGGEAKVRHRHYLEWQQIFDRILPRR
jgi:hypothetical protein